MSAFGRCGWGEGGRRARRPHGQTPGRWLDVGSALSVKDMGDTVRSRDLLRMHHEQIEAWMTEGKNRHAAMIAKVCLATGARWSEAESLEARQIRNG